MEIPVMGGPNVAIDGKLVIMASGKKEVFEKFKTVFDSIAEQSFYLGGTGTAHSIKPCNESANCKCLLYHFQKELH